MDDVLDRHGAHRSVERLVVKGQPRRLVQVVDDVISQSRIVSHLLCVQPQTNDFAGPKVPRLVRTPATHQVEKLPAGGPLLDLMSSWGTHLPRGFWGGGVIGFGVEAGGRTGKPRLTGYVGHDLNQG